MKGIHELRQNEFLKNSFITWNQKRNLLMIIRPTNCKTNSSLPRSSYTTTIKKEAMKLCRTPPYIRKHLLNHYINSGLRHLEYLIKSRETHLSGFVFNDEDQVAISRIFDVIISVKKDVLRNEDLIWMQVLTLAHILQRNMPEIRSNEHRTKDMQALYLEYDRLQMRTIV